MNKPRSLYIHIPFCEKICDYCDFTKLQYFRKFVIPYLDTLEKELKNYEIEGLKTIYIGGGTPTALDDDLFEKLLNHTIILGIPSKILGFIIGLIEGVVWTFIILYVLNLPIFNIKDIKESTLKKAVLDDTPILSNINNDIVDSLKEISEIKDKKTRKEKEKETLDIMIKYHIIDETTAESLIKK